MSDECYAKGRGFLHASFVEQYDIQRRHARRRFCFGDGEVDEAFRAVRLLPDNFRTFSVGEATSGVCRQQGARATLRRNESVLMIEDASKRLDEAVRTLKAACNGAVDAVALGAALLLVSGRRTAEMYNGRSRFSRGPNPMSALFGGQLKKQRPQPYVIPLLVPFELFARGVRALRALQGGELRGR